MKRRYPENRAMPEGWKHGTRNPASKLDWLKVYEIRTAPRGYGKTKALADRFGISPSMVRRIRQGHYWKFEGERAG